MLSKKSDTPAPPHAVPSATPSSSPWLITLVNNAWIPIAVVLIVITGRHFEYSSWPGPYAMHVVMLVGINIILAVSLQLINGVSGQFSLGHAGFMAVGAYLAGYATKTFAAIPDPNGDNPAADFYNTGSTLLFFIALIITVTLAAMVLFGLFMLIRQSRRLHASLPAILLLLICTWFVADLARGFNAGDADDSDTSTTVQPAPSKALIFTTLIRADADLYHTILTRAAPQAQWLSNLLPGKARKPATFFVVLLGGGAMAAIAGFIVGLPTLRLRGDYLAIATLGFGEIIRVVILNCPALGAATGLQISTYAVQPDPDNQIPGAYISPWIFGTALLCFITIHRLTHSFKGQAIRAVRDDEIAAASIGIDPTRNKVIAFVLGAFFAGVAGALYAHLDAYLNTASYGFMRSIELVVMVTLGGLGSLWGAAIAAVVLTILPELLRNISPAVADWRMVIYSLLLIGLMLLRTTPLWGSRFFRRRPLLARARSASPAAGVGGAH